VFYPNPTIYHLLFCPKYAAWENFFPHYKHEKQRANLLKKYGKKQQETLAGKCMKTKDMIYPIVVYILHTAKISSMIMNM